MLITAGRDIVSHSAADPSGRYGAMAKKANLALNFYACLDYESFEIYDRTEDGLPEHGIGYDTADGDTPFTTEVLARIIAITV